MLSIKTVSLRVGQSVRFEPGKRASLIAARGKCTENMQRFTSAVLTRINEHKTAIRLWWCSLWMTYYKRCLSAINRRRPSEKDESHHVQNAFFGISLCQAKKTVKVFGVFFSCFVENFLAVFEGCAVTFDFHHLTDFVEWGIINWSTKDW